VNPRRHDRIKAIFLEATGLPAKERPQFVERACGDDDALRREVESLLAHHDTRTIVADEGTPTATPPEPIAAPTARLGKGRRLGQYELEEPIGEGGMAQVFRARHVMLDRPTAVKIVKSEQATAEVLTRFESEVQLASRLTHPNTIEIYDYGRTPDGIFYCAMELVSGFTLAQLLALEGPLPPARAIHLLRQVCGSLREAHGLGLVHRDIKPQNIMVCQRAGDADVVKVLDFGLVKSIDAADRVADTAALAGTPLYMAPERLLDPLTTDTRSDIYSLGAVAFKLLTAKDVFPGGGAADILDHVLHTPPAHPAQVAAMEIPAELDRLIVACLAKELDDRPASIEEVLKVLDGLAVVDPWSQADALGWWQANSARLA
jgi:serine/threonine protein kinase